MKICQLIQWRGKHESLKKLSATVASHVYIGWSFCIIKVYTTQTSYMLNYLSNQQSYFVERKEWREYFKRRTCRECTPCALIVQANVEQENKVNSLLKFVKNINCLVVLVASG